MASAQAADEAEWIYTVRPDDSIWSIARDYLTSEKDWPKLVRHNQLADPQHLTAGTSLRIPLSWLRQQPAPAIAIEVHGEATLRHAHESSFRNLERNSSLQVGDEIRTGKGNIVVRFADGSVLRLQPQSALVFNTLTRLGKTGMVDSRTRLERGSISTEVAPQHPPGGHYEIATPSAVAAVRGTRFRLAVEPDATRAEVTEGTVYLSSGQKQLPLQAGFGTRLGPATSAPEAISLLPKPKTQGVPAVLSELPWTLHWQPQADAEQYQIEIYQQDLNGALQKTTMTNDASWQLSDLRNGQYLLALRAVDKQGLQGQEFDSPFQVNVQAQPAELLAPTDQEQLDQGRPQFSWNLTHKGDLSRLQIAADSAFAQILSESDYAAQTRVKPAQALAPGHYFWRVATLAGGDSLAYSEPHKLTLMGSLPDTAIVAVSYRDDEVRLFWRALNQAQNYVVQVASDSDFQNILREESVNDTSVKIRLPDHQRYYARVKGVAGDIYRSNFSAGREIQLP